MLIQILIMAGGLVLLIKGADWLVNGGSTLARKYHVSDLAIGLTIVAFGTSAPELVVNTIAAWEGHQDIVFGNIIGSNNFNLFIILGITGIITPIVVQSSTVWKEIPISMGAAVILFIMTNAVFRAGDHMLGRIDGIILLFFFALFLYYVYKQLKLDPAEHVFSDNHKPGWKIWGMIILGLAGLIAGGRFVVMSAVQMATDLGVSEKVIGLTIVAAGTSLPELTTSVVAAIRKNNDIAVGNIIGSNIFNILFILSISSIIRPVGYDVKFNTDLYILGAGTLFLFMAMFTGDRKKLDRWESLILLLAYTGYTVYLVNQEL